ncbi:hypothetical protein [Nocardia sp. CDC160]|uniref:hypothetical protein n=1 Tax=Nocardia sp. CDC160 TaxID=3112166 RepID=UPI002DB7BE80|nr:hypothetical protein [Nocardia sp. CDC160]MEC3917281.1 hypothetical protein [Nocardia sp. CDC160]
MTTIPHIDGPPPLWYLALLLVSGIVLLALTIPRSLDWWWRSANAACGSLCVGYWIYLAFFFHTGTYLIILKLFVLPAMLVVISVSALRGKRSKDR